MLPFALSLSIALALALAPAVVAWWTGRTVLARVNDPVLPELLFERRRRLAGFTLGGGVVLALLFADEAIWALPLLWIALLLSAYPLRRALFGERLSALAYLRYTMFGAIGHVGLWLLAAAAPAIVASLALGVAPNDQLLAVRVAVIAGATLALIIGLWQFNYSRVFLDLHRASSLRDLARPELMARLDAILDRAAPSLAKRPEVYRYGAPGAYVMNALAIPSRAHPAVALGDTLLATLTDEELTAVFAHEVAHHEQFNSARWRRARWRSVVLIVLLAALPALLVWTLPAAAMAISWCMPLVIAMMLRKRVAARREDETASDLRAIALGGSADALISALTKLHVYSRVPRRWPHAIEGAATHPSLARRIQALRDKAGAIARPEAHVAAPLTVVRSTVAGHVVAFDRDRAYWFDGVPTDAPLDLHGLRDAATSYRASSYADLAELRVGIADAGRSIEATDRDGRSWQVAIAPNDVARVQEVLDRVDLKLGRGRSLLAPASAVSVRWLMLALLVMLAGAGELGVAFIPILIAFVRPASTAAVAAAIGITVGRVLAGARLIAWADPVRQIALLLSLSIAVVLAVQTRRRVQAETTRGNARKLTREASTLAGVLVGIAAVIGISVWPLFAERPTSLLSHPLALSLASLLLGAGAALLTIPYRWWRASGALTSAAALGAGVFLSGDGWLFRRTASIAWASGRLTATSAVRISGSALTLTSSPNGAAFAVSQYQAPRRGQAPGTHYVIGRFDDPTHPTRVSTAAKIAFIDDATLVALDSAPGDSLELRAEGVAAVDGDVPVRWRARLPAVDEPKLLIDRSTRSWLVVGRGDGDWSFLIATDTLGGHTPRIYRLAGRSAVDVGEIMNQPLAAFPDGGAIWATVPGFRGAGAATITPVLLAFAATPRWELRGTDAAGERSLADIDGYPSCAMEFDVRGTICVERSPNGSHVWQATSAKAMQRVADLPPTLDLLHAESSDRVAAAERFGQRVVVLGIAERRALRLMLPAQIAPSGGIRWTADVVARDSCLLVLSTTRDGATVTRFVIR